MTCSLLQTVIQAFNSLWNCEVIDSNTIEIRVPYASINGKYVTLYIKTQGDDFVVTDSGYLREYYASELVKINSNLFESVIGSYLREFEIQIKDFPDRRLYFKKTSNIDFLPNCVFEMADFFRTYISFFSIASNDALVEDEDREERRFIRDAKEYISDTFAHNTRYNVTFNQLIGFENKQKRISAIVSTGNSMNCIQFLGGGKSYYYNSKINNTISDFKLLDGYPLIRIKLALFDDSTPVYSEHRSEIDDYLSLLEETTGMPPVPWSNRQQLLEILS